MSKIKFGLGALQAAQENYQIILDRLIRGYQKMMKKDPEGLDLIKIKQEARQRADESAKVVDMEGKTLNPEKPIMGGTQQVEKTSRKLTDEEYGELVDEFGEGVPLGIETVEDAQKFVKRQKDYEAEMFQEYKMGKLDPKRGEPNRRRFLEKKADEGQLSRSEAEELADMDFGENLKKTYDEAKGPGKGDEMVEALRSPGARASTDIIEKQLQETFPDIKLFGDETFEEILEIQKTGKHPRMKADGGRINFMLGGPTNIIGAGLGGLEGLTPMEATGALGAPTGLMAGDVQRPTSGYETKEGREQRDKALEDIFDELPKDMQDMIRGQQMKDIKGQTAGIGIVSGLKGLGLLGDYLINQGRAKIANRGLDVALKNTQQKQIREAAEKAAVARVAALADINRNLNIGGYQSSFGSDDDFMSGSGTAAEMGSFAKGGLATMFTRKR